MRVICAVLPEQRRQSAYAEPRALEIVNGAMYIGSPPSFFNIL